MKHHRSPEDLARMLMTRAPATAAADDRLLDAAAKMADRGIRHLPVIDGDRHLVGILSDRDVRSALGDYAAGGVPANAARRALRVGDAMTREAYTVNQNAAFEDVVQVFTDQRVGAVPVVDDADQLVGIISYVDVLKNAGAL